MATWAELQADVVTWTNRPTLVAETQLALRNAIRTAHRQGKFWRDLTTVPVTLVANQVQTLILTDTCPRMRQLAYVKDIAHDGYLEEAQILDLLDSDGFPKNDVYWGIGDNLNIRSAYGSTSYEIAYYRQPVTTPPESIEDWLLRDYFDVVVLLAAASVLGSVGEQEIKSRVDALLLVAMADMVSDQLEVTGR